jgi:FixJ family two-component response regulator
MSAKPTVFVVDDDEEVRNSLAWLLESAHLAVETFPTASSFLAKCKPGRRGCVVLDVRIPDMSGLDLQQRLIQRGILMPVIIITGYADVPVAVRAMKPVNDQLWLDRVQQAIREDAEANRFRVDRHAVAERIATLSRRELQVADMVVEGMSTRKIAEALGLKQKTVEAHRAKVMEKMCVRTVAEWVRIMVLYRGR